ncbi:MAG: cupin domain-containing protein, partial [Nocardioides sp.]
TFTSKVWASLVHRHETDPGDLVRLLSLDDADALLTGSGIRTPAVRVAQDGSVLGDAAFVRQGATIAGKPLSGLVDPRKALELFAGGATVVFQGLHRYHPPLTDLVARLELELGHPCQANAYLTPPGSQGFAVHEDSHDVFVFQTHGTKLWEIHHPRGERACEHGSHGDDCRVDDVLLRPGVSMYLPTGTPHAARAQDEASLHVTIGINQLTWRGAVRRAVEDLLGRVEDQHLPAGWTERPDLLAAGLAEHLAELSRAMTDVDADAAATAEVRRFLTGRNGRLRGGLHDVLAVDRLGPETVLTRRAGRPCVVTPLGSDRLRVLIGDRSLDVPARLAAAFDVVCTASSLTPADLGLDPQSNLVLARRLVREGLLQVGPPVTE